MAVLASGDPLWYGIGRLLLRHVLPSEVTILPHVSAFQEACSRLGWPLEEVHAVTAHGRPVAALRRQHGRRLLVLTADGAAPAEIGRCLAGAGFASSRTVVLEELGGADERLVEGTATDLGGERFADLNLMAVELVADPGRQPLPVVADCPTPRLPMTASSPSPRFARSPWRPSHPATANCCGMSEPAPAASPSSGCGRVAGCGRSRSSAMLSARRDRCQRRAAWRP